MAQWDSAATDQFSQIKTASNSTDAQMADLKVKIEAWANQNPDGWMEFDFGQMRTTRVQVKTVGGWIKSLDYGGY